MNVTPFPLRKGWVQPVVEIYAPSQTATGLYEVFVWQNRDRNEGFMARVPELRDALKILEMVKATFTKGKA